jgi:prevent-host-death family protein
VATVGVKELKNRLSHYLDRTKQGEEVVITDRGRPVAVLQPLRPDTTANGLDVRLARLAAAGWLNLPSGRRLERIRPVRVCGKPVSQTILEDREDRS